MTKLTPGLKVKFTTPRPSAAGWMTDFFNQTGIAERKCTLYPGAWIIRFGGVYAVSLYPDELEEVKN